MNHNGQKSISTIPDLFSSGATIRESGGNRPLPLDDPGKVWVVKEGSIDVSFVKRLPGNAFGTRRHLFRAEPGDALFGMEAGDRNAVLLAVGTVGSQMLEITRELFEETALRNRVLERLLLRWFEGLSAWASQITPAHIIEIGQGEAITIQEKTAFRAAAGIAWVRSETGQLFFAGREDLRPIPPGTYFPLTPGSAWLRTDAETTVSAGGTSRMVSEGLIRQALADFHQRILDGLLFDNAKREKAEAIRLAQKSLEGEAVLSDAVQGLASVLQGKSRTMAGGGYSGRPLLQACRKVGSVMGLQIKPPPGSQGEESLEEIVRASRIRSRLVILRGRWWREDNGPLLGFREEGKGPVALIPASATSYDLHDPVADTVRHVTETEAHSLSAHAYTFYTPFPERAVTGKEMLKMALRGCRKDIFFVFFMGALGSLLGLLPPIITGQIFGDIIPEAARSRLFQMVVILLSCAVGTTLFEVTKGIALMRIEGRTDAALQSALIDRLISLPPPFFRRYTVGDLANRSLGINAIRQILSSVAVTAILGVIFSISNLILVFYYSWKLFLVAFALTSIGLLFFVAVTVYQTKIQGEIQEIDGKTAGMLLQFITGISKIRVSGTENMAFASWAELFKKNKLLSYQVSGMGGILTTFQSFFSVITTLVIFAWVVWQLEGKLPLGEYMTFSSAYGNFQGAFSQMAMAVTSSLVVFPLYRRLQPIVQALPESDEYKAFPGELSGNIEVSHLHFRYGPDDPLVLKDISLQVRPGEFVAIVGGSGSGKSTLVRLLLGFEKPESGGIYYDGQDLATLDVREVRRQIGVVLQNSRLMSGDIFKNIVGTSLLTMEDAWEAARMVGLDRDIEEMPMKMMTMVSPGGTNLSGGQRQRLLIARALVRRPRIIFFDEATSALDNKTQAIVSQSLGRLRVARVVIAHRLSTIIHADRIYVLDHGEVKETGNYEELMKKGGTFYELAKRQII